jgi:hypothetical protein
VTIALPAWGQDTPPNLSPLHGQDGSVARLIEAHRLADLGTSARDPVLLLAAARLMQGVTLREVPRERTTPVEQPAEKPAKKKGKEPPKAVAGIPVVPDPAQQAPLAGLLDAPALMEQARALLPQGSLMRDAVADLAAETPPPGPVAQVTSLVQGPNGETTFALPLAGQSYAEIGLLRLGPGHLTLRVTDAAGHPVCQDASAGPAVLCGLVPRESDRFLVTIGNDGTDAAPYLLITN